MNNGRTCYFHNFGGYDAILSLPQLLYLPKNLSFYPIIGERISIKFMEIGGHLTKMWPIILAPVFEGRTSFDLEDFSN
jgi:hypothetical protein